MSHLISAERPLQLLLIEDNRGDAMFIEKMLKNAMVGAVKIKRAMTLSSALKTLGEASFDVALLDRSLPDVEGFNGLYSIQNFVPTLPVIFLTAYQDESTAFEAIEQGAQDYLFKDKMDGHAIKRAIQYAMLRKQFEDILIMRANFDMLTGLANRLLFESKLDMALAKMRRVGSNLALLFLDLDRFKQVNDTLGHAAGDQLLKEVGIRLKAMLRSYDTAARLGGDEFAVLLENIPTVAHAEIIAQKIIDMMAAPFIIMGKTVTIGVSIGIASCLADKDTPSSAELTARADAAMYLAKANSGNHYCIDTADSERINGSVTHVQFNRRT